VLYACVCVCVCVHMYVVLVCSHSIYFEISKVTFVHITAVRFSCVVLQE